MIELTSITTALREPNGQTRLLFEELDFQVGAQERSVAILGRSGSGKSTLLRILAGLDLGYQGSYRYDGEVLAPSSSVMADHRARTIGIITQRYDLLGDRSVAGNVRMGVRPGTARATAGALVSDYLALVGLEGFERKNPRRLSGGEAQRVAIARALVKGPRIVLADEPTGALDQSTEEGILDLFDLMNARGSAFIIATHSERVAQRCERRLLLENGRLRELE